MDLHCLPIYSFRRISGLQRVNSARDAEAREMITWPNVLLKGHTHLYLSEIYPLTLFRSNMLTSVVHVIH